MQASGAKVISSATTVAEALWVAEQGVDAIIAQGVEAGGHRGHFLDMDLGLQQAMLPLVESMVAQLELPIIAAGGIGSRGDVLRALEAGASAVQVGTAYLLTPEAQISPLHRQAIAAGTQPDTALTNLFSGRPARGIVNRLMQDLGPVRNDLPSFPLAGSALTTLRTAAEAQGKSDFSPLWAGSNFAHCRSETAADVTQRLGGREP